MFRWLIAAFAMPIGLLPTPGCAAGGNSHGSSSGAHSLLSDSVTINRGNAILKKFQSHGKAIRTEWYGAQAGQPKWVVLVLPGSGGLEPEGGFFRDLAKSLAGAGATVVIVHYMDRNGLTDADSVQMSAHFGEWLQTTRDAVDFVKSQPRCAKAQVCLLGHSLGAQLALHESASDKRIDAVLDMAGSFVLPTKNITHMPRVLILHGRADRVVPLSREHQLVAVLKRTDSKYSEHIFPRCDHVFNNVTMEELSNLMIDFLGLG